MKPSSSELPSQEELALAKIIGETAQIEWRMLQKFFAAGQVLSVDQTLDLIDVVFHFSNDNEKQVGAWLDQKLVKPVEDNQALNWYETDAIVWACVVKPWILVQPLKSSI